MVVVLAVKFWVVVPENLRNTKEYLSVWCVGGTRLEALLEGGWGKTLPWTSEIHCHKANCPCCEQLDRTCTSQKDQRPQDRIHLQKKEFHTNFSLPTCHPNESPFWMGPNSVGPWALIELTCFGKACKVPIKSLFEQEAPKIGTQKCSTKRGVREPLHVRICTE